MKRLCFSTMNDRGLASKRNFIFTDHATSSDSTTNFFSFFFYLKNIKKNLVNSDRDVDNDNTKRPKRNESIIA